MALKSIYMMLQGKRKKDKVHTTRTEDTRSGLKQAGITDEEMKTDAERAAAKKEAEKKAAQEAAQKNAERKIPDVPRETAVSIAERILEEERKKKAAQKK